MSMHGPYIDLLVEAYKRHWPGPVPPPEELVWLPFVGPYLRRLRPVPISPDAAPRPAGPPEPAGWGRDACSSEEA